MRVRGSTGTRHATPVGPKLELRLPEDVWGVRGRAMPYRDPVLDDCGCGCRTGREGSMRRKDACRNVL